jgi:orotidine-5'-phosphate decarboxylase
VGTLSEPNQSQVGSAWSLFRELWSKGNLLCVGLDPSLELLPNKFQALGSLEDALFSFNREIVDATNDLVCSYKPNSAFYEQYGDAGLRVLAKTIRYINDRYPAIPVILDAKRADIGSTTEAYAHAAFDVLGANAITVNPYLGKEALAPMLARQDRGILVLAKSSNPGAGEFQDLQVGDDGLPLYELIARRVAEEWNANGNCGLVIGATYPSALHKVREHVGNMPILIPGLGVQGGIIEDMVRVGLDQNRAGVIANASRSVIYASSSDSEFAQAARTEAKTLADRLRVCAMSSMDA